MKLPGAIRYTLWMDFTDKYSFYGMKAILPAFLLGVVGFSEASTVFVMQIFLSITYLAMILATFVAGRFISYYGILIIASFVSFVGHFILSYSGQAINVYIGVAIISIGSGIIQIAMPAMIVEQCKENKKLINKSMSLVYLFTNLGTVSILITPWVYNKFGYSLAFLSPTLAVFVSGVILLFGKKYYVPQKYIKPNFCNLEDLKPIVKIALILGIFYVFLSQIYSSWVIQGTKMNGFIFGYQVLPAQMQFLDTIFVVTLLPLLIFKIIPILQKRGLFVTDFSQISLGLLFAFVSFFCVAIIQYFIDFGYNVSLLWQIVPYFLIALAEVLARVVAINYIFTAIPGQMSTVVGILLAVVNLLTNTVFSAFFGFFAGANIAFFIFCAVCLFMLLIFSLLKTFEV